jgi:pilus assembly protein CpaE
MSSLTENRGAPEAGVLSIALIGPDERRRKAIVDALGAYQARAKGGIRQPADSGEPRSPAGPDGSVSSTRLAVREFYLYPADFNDVPRTLEQNFDVVIVELDSDPEYALDLVESICSSTSAVVMVYSENADIHVAVRVMRAGAREFLILPLSPDDVDGALERVSIRRPAPHAAEKALGSLFVFFGTKGGSGVTTIASNFALSLAQESGKETLLIDFGLPLGDVAINLGMTAEYSTANALHDYVRLDTNFLSRLLAKHSSGLYVLAAPNEFTQAPTTREAIDKLIAVARRSYDYVVVDAGSRLDMRESSLFNDAATIYLVTQVGVSELRNANRLISHFFFARGRTLQIVVNRYIPGDLGLDEKDIAKALTRPIQWRIPDDYADARRTRNTATPLALGDSPISVAIRQMARTACGLTPTAKKKKRFGLFS